MSIVNNLFKKFSFNERQIKRYEKIVFEINRQFEKYIKEGVNPKELTDLFKHRLKEGEDLNNILVEAFALVKYVMKNLYDEKYKYSHKGMSFLWDMIPYDVQIMGSIALHEGNIIEMATGEGKTLVAVMPLYLNALTDRGVYLITVNDYLARRDRYWMGVVYEHLGVSVGLIQTDMKPNERRKEYEKDIVYITNNEFGFDYLRDNMAMHKRDRVHRDSFYYCIIDEIDSVLIDEARTPLIISGLPMDDEDKERTKKIYDSLKSSVRQFVSKQKEIIEGILNKAEGKINENEFQNGIYELLKVKRGYPKHKKLLQLMQNADISKEMEHLENALIRDKKLHKLDEDLLFSIDERSNAVHITDKGEKEFTKLKGDNEFFLLPEISFLFDKIDKNEELSEEEKIKEKERINKEYAKKSEHIHAMHQLLKAFVLFERDVEYIVKDGKIIIVDEHTGRLMPGRRFSEGMHSAIEAKENVFIQEETKTLATITLQNLFKMFEKLSGMTGTAATEAKEFKHIYNADVIVIPTNRPVIREDRDDSLFIKKKDKINYIVNRILKIHNAGVPLLIGTASVASSEYLDNILKNKKNILGKRINYNVLNAKNHEREAEIVAEAGQKGAITIATNMAGRGTDIKLKKEVKSLPERSALIQALRMSEAKRNVAVIYKNEISLNYIKQNLDNDQYLVNKKHLFSFEVQNGKIPILSEKPDDFEIIEIPLPPPLIEEDKEAIANIKRKRVVCIDFDERGNCIEYVPAGLYVLGTEKHESRRIDRQLRGRSGRQGDPGASQFTVSLEDDLMRIFGSDRMSALINRLESMSGANEAISHKMLTTSIEKAQKRIENLNFERRKFLLEYDDVINKQREIIYEIRNFFLFKVPPIEYVNKNVFNEIIAHIIGDFKQAMNDNNIIKMQSIKENINYIFAINISIEQLKENIKNNNLQNYIDDILLKQTKEHLIEVKDYVLENIPEIAYDFIINNIPANTYSEQWDIDMINEFFMNNFNTRIKEKDFDSVKEFAEYAKNTVYENYKNRFQTIEQYESFIPYLLFTISINFIGAIDAQWVDQLYELEAIREGITLRGYAQKNPLVEFKREAYLLFSELIDNIYKEFSKRFFSINIFNDMEKIKTPQHTIAKKQEVFANTSDNVRPKKQPLKKTMKKVGRNEKCPCGSGKKYKHCCGKK